MEMTHFSSQNGSQENRTTLALGENKTLEVSMKNYGIHFNPEETEEKLDITSLDENKEQEKSDEVEAKQETKTPEEVLFSKTDLDLVNLRAEPSKKSASLRVLPKGTRLQIIGQVDETWVKVCDSTGLEGYVVGTLLYPIV